MTTATYYLQLESDTVVGYHSYEVPKVNFDKASDIVRISTNEPEKYIGLARNQILLDPLPLPTPDESYKNEQSWRRNELKRLFYEIQFTVELTEDKTALKLEYDNILIEYNNNKE